MKIESMLKKTMIKMVVFILIILAINLVIASNILVNGDFKIDDDLYVDIENGYVGIGTTTPSYNLHVVGTAAFDGSAVFQGSLKIPVGQPTPAEEGMIWLE
jgi:hypothetical protein